MLRVFKILILVLIISGVAFGFGLNNKGEAQPELNILVKKEKPIKTPRPLFVPDEIIVKFKSDTGKNSIEILKKTHRVSEKYTSPFTGSKVFKIPKDKTVSQIVEILKKSPLVEYAEPNYYAYASMIPNDPLYYPYQWHFDNPNYGGIQMEKAWDINTGDSNIVVAVIDTGVAYEDYPTEKYWHLDTYNAYGNSGYSWWCGMSNNSNWVNPPGYSNLWEQYLVHELDLTTAIGDINLSFRHKYDVENDRDFCYVEVSDNDGSSWTELVRYTGNSHNWKRAETVDLTPYGGNTILLRFRFNSDSSYSDGDGNYNSDGAWYVDKIKITDNSDILFYDDMEAGVGNWQTDSLPFQKAPDLVNTSFTDGYDFIDEDFHANDEDGHGTHVTGTIAQSTNNNLGAAGIAFNTTIMPIRVLGPAGGTYQQIADGIHYAADNGANIINMSLGGSGSSSILENALAYAYNKEVTIIAASGNDSSGQVSYPAAYDAYVIAVGATRYDETIAYYSNYGSSLDLTAPGGDVTVDQNSDTFGDGVLQNTFGDTLQDWGYWLYQGTSMAAPHVSGVAALLLAQDSNLTPSEVRNAMESTAKDLGDPCRDDIYGHGLLNAYAALESISVVSISISDGAVDFGTMAFGAQADNSNDVQTISVDGGMANLKIKTTVFCDDSENCWGLDPSLNNGINQVKWEFSPDSNAWTTFSVSEASYDLANNIANGDSQNLHLRITMPADSTSSSPYGSTVTIVATSSKL